MLHIPLVIQFNFTFKQTKLNFLHFEVIPKMMGLRFWAELNVGPEFCLRLSSGGFGHARRYRSSLFLLTRLETGIIKQESLLSQRSLSLWKSCGGMKELITFPLKAALHLRVRIFSRTLKKVRKSWNTEKVYQHEEYASENIFFQKKSKCK